MITIKRNILAEVKNHLEKKEISLIIGPRQVGKTTLMYLLKDYLEKNGKNTLFLNLDNEMDCQFFSSQENLINKIKLELGNTKSFVFIDEIQRKQDAGIFLKGIYDLNLPYKFIISGSGSIELKEKIHESLVGRKRIFELNPVSFDEFVNFKTDYNYENKLNDFFDLEKERVNNFLHEYLNFGGYPRIVLEETLEEKIRNIDEIYRSYIEKDIIYLLKVEKIEAFSSLIKILASQTGQLINYSEISSTIGISLQTLKNYFWYGEKTFVIQRLTPFFQNIRKEISKSPVVYFYDLGLRNYSLGLFRGISHQKELGSIFENFIFNILKEEFKYTGSQLHFWRTKDKAEVDFVINSGKDIIPFEVKFKKINKEEISRSFRNFIAKYNPSKAFIINLSSEKKVNLNKTEVIFLPFWKLFEIKSFL